MVVNVFFWFVIVVVNFKAVVVGSVPTEEEIINK